MNWRRGGQLLRAHRMPVCNPDNGVVTSVALDEEWVVVGLSNCRIHVFSAKTGVLSRTLIGHELGVWAVHLVSRGGYFDREDVIVEESCPSDSGDRDPRTGEESRQRPEKAKKRTALDGDADGLTGALSVLSLCVGGTSSVPPAPGLHHLVPPSLRTALGLDRLQRTPRRLSQSWSSDPPLSPHGESDDSAYEPDPDVGKPSDVCCASEGWGQPNALVISGGCDKVLRVWDVKSGCKTRFPSTRSSP
jgi:F-box and WD-40 domain protein CDC4